MQRQLRNEGGVMTIKTIRKKYGLGDLVGDVGNFVRKLIPNELADVAVKAAPFVAPFNPLAAAAMRGIGRFDQRGSISDALKQGAGTFAFGYGARKLGGADGIGGFSMDSFSSPLSSERTQALGNLFKSDSMTPPDAVTKFKKTGTGLKGLAKKVIKKLPQGVAAQLVAGGLTAGASLLASNFQGDFREQEPGETMEDYLAARKEAVGSQMRTYMDNYFKFDKDYSTMTDAQRDAFVARYNVRDGGIIRLGFDNGGVSSIFGNPDQLEYEEFMKKRSRNIITFESNLAKRLMNKYDLDSNTARRYAGTINFYVNSNPRMLSGKEKILEEGYLGNNEIILKEIENKDNINSFAINRSKGGIMDVPVKMNSEGVKELDMRKTGGFVPIGVKEKADDVPAMLSKNEFVMTADAVRAAGGGSIQKGAQRMYDTMKKLESRVA